MRRLRRKYMSLENAGRRRARNGLFSTTSPHGERLRGNRRQNPAEKPAFAMRTAEDRLTGSHAAREQLGDDVFQRNVLDGEVVHAAGPEDLLADGDHMLARGVRQAVAVP